MSSAFSSCLHQEGSDSQKATHIFVLLQAGASSHKALPYGLPSFQDNLTCIEGH